MNHTIKLYKNKRAIRLHTVVPCSLQLVKINTIFFHLYINIAIWDWSSDMYAVLILNPLKAPGTWIQIRILHVKISKYEDIMRTKSWEKLYLLILFSVDIETRASRSRATARCPPGWFMLSLNSYLPNGLRQAGVVWEVKFEKYIKNYSELRLLPS